MKSTLARYLLAVLLLVYAGCYDTEIITKERLPAGPDRDITVFTKDSLEYRFPAENYRIIGDSLSGVGVQIIDVWPVRKDFTGSIPLSNIAQVKTDKFNPRKTVAIVTASFLVASFALSVAVAAAILNGHH